jgi:hypothetical protein
MEQDFEETSRVAVLNAPLCQFGFANLRNDRVNTTIEPTGAEIAQATHRNSPLVADLDVAPRQEIQQFAIRTKVPVDSARPGHASGRY